MRNPDTLCVYFHSDFMRNPEPINYNIPESALQWIKWAVCSPGS